MANVKYYRKQDGLILLAYSPAPNRRIKVSTGQHCHESEWNKKKQRASTSARFRGNASLNALLDRLRDVVTGLDAETRLHYQRVPTPAEVKAAVYAATARGGEQEHEITLPEFFRAAVEKKGRSLSAGRIRQYKALLGHVDRFGVEFYPMAWGNLNGRFAEDFEAYSFQVMGHSNNTFVKHFTMLKTLLKDAVQAGHWTEEQYNAFRALWRGQSEDEPTLTYLTPPELDKLWSMELTGRLARVRDMAIAQAYTGVRHSDLHKVKLSSIIKARDYQGGQDLELIYIVQEKTKTAIKVPLHPYVRTVLERLEGGIPDMSIQKYNKYLKEVFEVAGIDARTTTIRNKGKDVKTGPKWQFITSHVLRATAATNLYAMGVPESTIMVVLGWKKREVFQRYIRLAQESQAGIIARSEYFKGGKVGG